MAAGSGYDERTEDEDFYGSDEFAFEDGDESLPWLEADDDDVPAGFDTGRLVGIALLMVVLLGAIVGGIWWLTNGGAGGGPEPDGSTVAAPEGPFKVSPEDEGGKTFPGTGDTSFAVGEGKTREGRLASKPPAQTQSAPSLDTLTTPEPAGTSPAPAPRSQALPSGTAVQVGAYSNRADAEAGWRTINRQTDVLAGVDYRIVQGQADIGTVFRLQAVGGDAANARRLCRELGAAGLPCAVK
jgi:hypothetical protein